MTSLAVSIEQRYDRLPDGSVWAPQFGYPFWTRYLEVFESIRVVARVRKVAAIPAGWQRADGPAVSFFAIPYYVGPWDYLKHAWDVRQAVRQALGPDDAVIMRLDSQLAACIFPLLRKDNRPYGVEVVVDPYDVFAPGSKHPLRPFFRWKFSSQLKRQCAGACAAAFVTECALQRRYPPSPTAFSTFYSSVELPTDGFADEPRHNFGPKNALNLITVGAMEDVRKSQDIVIAAVSACVRQGMDIQLFLAGDGGYRTFFMDRARELGVLQRTKFLGHLSLQDLRVCLDQADVFVLPSRGEGLPRAMIEAMARGLPAIGSTVGGFPELLPPEDLVLAGDVEALVSKLHEVLRSPARLARMSARNLKKAHEYAEDVLRVRRNKFYVHLRERTDAWLKTR
jgi:glycosyltransferase involved in cell wall biosynthesis